MKENKKQFKDLKEFEIHRKVPDNFYEYYLKFDE
jgi:hypothetical protein